MFYLSYAVLWLLVVFQSLVLLGLARAVYRTNNLAGNAVAPHPSNWRLIGQPVPRFSAYDISGTLIDETALAKRVSALLFVAPDCTSCTATLDELEALRFKAAGTVVVICRAGREECKRLREVYNLDEVPIVVDEDRRMSELFDVHVAPTAVLIGADGHIQTYGHPARTGEFADMLAHSEAPTDAERRAGHVAASHA